MLREVTFADVEKLLFKLGFVFCSTNETQQVFKYPPLGTLIVLPAYDKQAPMRPIHLVAIRRTLIENELIKPAAFDGFLEKVST